MKLQRRQTGRKTGRHASGVHFRSRTVCRCVSCVCVSRVCVFRIPHILTCLCFDCNPLISFLSVHVQCVSDMYVCVYVTFMCVCVCDDVIVVSVCVFCEHCGSCCLFICDGLFRCVSSSQRCLCFKHFIYMQTQNNSRTE